MKLRILIIVTLVSALLLVGIGAVLAATPRDADGRGWGWHDRVPATGQMRDMHEQMPAGQQVDCDRMHGEMGDGESRARSKMGPSGQ